MPYSLKLNETLNSVVILGASIGNEISMVLNIFRGTKFDTYIHIYCPEIE